ncbi:MAG: alpha-hydroxy-acid oxidizing protein [Lewinellaceae bacterium]|nr:lactate 2-monooxygenase [Saprospiraceae bacterium]MCB9340243.1 alpha-hydroxy-acid oxidizing protein [Lewinellaceae bacterium]
MKFEATKRQKDIYLQGFAGTKPVVPVRFDKLEAMAKQKMSKEAFAYIAGGAGLESTMENNRRGFDAYQIIPSMLQDVAKRDTSIQLFGYQLPAPILTAPIGVLELAHPGADIDVARAASGLGLPMIFSNQASFPMEKCAAQMGSSPRWFQLYWSKSDELTKSLLHRAADCGCSAIVLTLDTTMLGWRPRDLDLAYLPFLGGMGIAQYVSDPIFQEMIRDPAFLASITNEGGFSIRKLVNLIRLVNKFKGGSFFEKLRKKTPIAAVRKFTEIYSRPSITWKELAFLKKHSKLPILLKGILSAADAKQAIEYGMDGIIVSNHGGRQIAGAISAVKALKGVVAAVDGKIPVLMDSGIRDGSDIFKAIAIGAKAVCIGRPYAYGLAIAGEAGVREVLQNLMADFELTMGLCGCRTIKDIGPEKLTNP